MFDSKQLEMMSKATAYDSKGDKVGSVGQIYADNETNEPTFATVNTGLFGTSHSFVPLQGARMQGDDLHLQFTKDQIKDAPRIDEDGSLEPAEEDRLYAHYGLGNGHTSTHTTGTDHGRTAAGVAGGVGGPGTAVAGERDHTAATHTDHTHADREHATRGRDGVQTVTAHEERLAVGTETREAGRARLRKYVTTEKETIEVPVQKEKLVVEREDVSGTVRKGGLDEHGTGEVEETITLREERPVVEKETVESERVRIGTEKVQETERVSGEVRKEHIDVEGHETGLHADKDRDHRR